MDKQEKIRLILNKVTELEHQSFCMGKYSVSSGFKLDKFTEIENDRQGLRYSLLDLLEDLF